ncbi:SEL1-like repeat protein [Streptomyces mirabilis]|uniref:SEL1-like repeat protein n=1 Tax=Streptomyces mirabilis TaxID=68239 RepID=UPI00167C488E|nr:tetratricopeptide repeat protein [Streptomyces mirabilis]
MALVGPLLAVVVLTAAPAGVKAGELPWPKWLVAGVVAAAGVLVAVWTPLVKARTDALAARTTREAEREAQAEAALGRLPTLKRKALLVRDMNDRALLGIHEAIPLPTDSDSDNTLSAELPTYVPRDIDADLRAALEARSRTGGFVLLVGPAASGKTRCAYEAIRAVLPHWRLLMPPDGATLNEMVAGDADLKHSVVWLNETQNFLAGEDCLKASMVRRLLADTTKPVILIGTIWPTFYDQLRIRVTTADEESEGGHAFDKDARGILELARRFSLGKWSDQEWDRAKEMQSVDPRIRQASLHRGQTGLTQILSAAPELVHRWEQAETPFGQAAITAAVAARRCNHPENMPIAIIEALAKEFLTDFQRATAKEDWLTDALMWACRPVHHSGGIAPLQAYGKNMGQIDGYRVSDILVDHKSKSAPIPDGQIAPDIWETLAESATPQACLLIGMGAYSAGVLGVARSAWERAANTGNAEAMAPLGVLLHNEGDAEGARTWWQQGADAGNTGAMTALGAMLHDEGDVEGARTWFIRASNAGNANAMTNLAGVLYHQGDTEGARTWWQQAADEGDADGTAALANFLYDQGDTEGARTRWQQAADEGNTQAMANLGVLLANKGDIEGARTFYTRASNAGNANAMTSLGMLLSREGDAEGARALWQQAADEGNTQAMTLLGIALDREGDAEGARALWQQAADEGNTYAMTVLGVALDREGDTEGARALWQQAADEGNDMAAQALRGFIEVEE